MLANVKKDVLAKFQLPFFVIAEFFKAIWIISKYKIELIHAHWMIPQGLIAVVLKRIFGIPVVITVHGTDVRKCPEIIRKLILGNANAIVSPHPELTEILTNAGYCVDEVRNLVGEYYVTREDVLKLKKELDLKDNIIITFIARLDEFKDPTTFVRSAPYVLDKRKNIRFLLVGEGDLDVSIRNIVREENLGEFVKVMGKRDDIGNILSISTIFVALSPVENIWSLAIIEAMKCGIPCIVTNSGTTAKHLRHGEHAYLIKPRDEVSLANAIIELSEDAEYRGKLAENSLILLDENGFSTTYIVGRVISVYHRCLKQI